MLSAFHLKSKYTLGCHAHQQIIPFASAKDAEQKRHGNILERKTTLPTRNTHTQAHTQ